MILIFKGSGLKFLIALGWFSYSCLLNALDWSSVPVKEVMLFYPGKASWEKILMSEFHGGAKGVRSKATCQSCHQGDESLLGENIASDKSSVFYSPLNTDFQLKVSLQIAVENEMIHFRVDLPASAQGRLSLMVDNDAYMHSALSGCWSTCHDDAQGMDSAQQGQKLTKYLSLSRTTNSRTGGGDSYKNADELAALMKEGQYLEIIGADILAGQIEPLHGYVLEKRHMSDLASLASAGVAAQAEKIGNRSAVVISRPLSPRQPGFKGISSEVANSLGIAFHPTGGIGRSHLVSFSIGFEIDQTNNVVFLDQ